MRPYEIPQHRARTTEPGAEHPHDVLRAARNRAIRDAQFLRAWRRQCEHLERLDPDAVA